MLYYAIFFVWFVLAAIDNVWGACELDADDYIYHRVSLIDIIANTEEFDSTLVRVEGFLDWENCALMLTNEDIRHHVYKNGIWIETENCIYRRSEQNELIYCFVQGEVSAENLGPEELFSGTVHTVYEYVCRDLNL